MGIIMILFFFIWTNCPEYYSSYSHTSGGSVSFPSLGGIFSLVPHVSPSDQSLSSSDDIYTSNTNTPTPPSTSNTSSSNFSSTYTPPHYTGCPCADCVKKYAYQYRHPSFTYIPSLTFNYNA